MTFFKKMIAAHEHSSPLPLLFKRAFPCVQTKEELQQTRIMAAFKHPFRFTCLASKQKGKHLTEETNK